MTKDQINQALLALTILGAVVCFALGKSEAGMVLMAFAGGHSVPSPLNRTPSLERVEQEQDQ